MRKRKCRIDGLFCLLKKIFTFQLLQHHVKVSWRSCYWRKKKNTLVKCLTHIIYVLQWNKGIRYFITYNYINENYLFFLIILHLLKELWNLREIIWEGFEKKLVIKLVIYILKCCIPWFQINKRMENVSSIYECL